jgi:hypothetical protein
MLSAALVAALLSASPMQPLLRGSVIVPGQPRRNLADAIGTNAVVTASGTTTGRLPADRFGESAHVLDHGAKCDGTTDDAAAVQRALDAGTRVVRFPPGTCRIASARTFTADVELLGQQTTLLFDFVGIGMTGTGRKVTLRNLVLDGNGKAEKLLDLTSSEVHAFAVTFRNVYSATNAAVALSCFLCTLGEVRGCTFANVRSRANSVEGDSPGAARAIFVSGATPTFVISGNAFSDVHSVNASNVPVQEDGDAIQCYGDADQGLIVEGNSFSNIGKRAVKVQCSRAVVRDNLIVSDHWTSYAAVMFAGVAVFGSNVTVAGNRILGSYYQHGIEVNTAGTTGVLVEGNTIDDAAAYTASGPYGQRSGIYTTGQLGLRVSKNRVSGFRNGFFANGGTSIVVSSNVLSGVERGTDVETTAVTGMVVTDNVIVGRSNAAGSANIGSYFLTGSEGLVISGNAYRTLYDGISLGGNPADGTIVGNAFTDIGRNKLTEQASPTATKAGNSGDVLRTTTSQDFASMAAGTCATDVTLTVTGAKTGAQCLAGAALPANALLMCEVSAADTVKLRVCNVSLAALDPASMTYALRVFNP